MNKYEELANEIIDRISEIIEDNYPEITPKCITNDDIESPALINGTIYYNLEVEIADKIKKFVKNIQLNKQGGKNENESKISSGI